MKIIGGMRVYDMKDTYEAVWINMNNPFSH